MLPAPKKCHYVEGMLSSADIDGQEYEIIKKLVELRKITKPEPPWTSRKPRRGRKRITMPNMTATMQVTSPTVHITSYAFATE